MNSAFKSLRNHSNGFVAPADAHRFYKKSVKQDNEDSKSKKHRVSKLRKQRMPKGIQFITGDDNCTEMPAWLSDSTPVVENVFEDIRWPTWEYNTFSNKPGVKKSRKHEEAEEELGDELFSIVVSKMN